LTLTALRLLGFFIVYQKVLVYYNTQINSGGFMFYAKEVWEWLTGKVADKEDLSYLDEVCF
jgi:hypothetical protein